MRQLLTILLLMVATVGVGYPQQALIFKKKAIPEMQFTTGASNGFNLTFTNSGATLHWIWPAGSSEATSDSNNPTVNVAAGVIRVQSSDGFAGVTAIIDNSATKVLSGVLPTLPTGLVYLTLQNDSFSGTMPTLPSGLVGLSLWVSNFSGTLPVLPSGLNYAYINCDASNLSAIAAGAFSTQRLMNVVIIYAASASQTNQILAESVTSLGISGRIAENLTINGSAPTGQGITDKATLVNAGWTVTTN